jgi:hypothetical protein
VLVKTINSWPKPGRGYVVVLRLRALPSPYHALAARLGTAV